MNAHLRLPAAVLWDLDGTLIDSEPYWFATETALMESNGVVWTHEDALNCVGRNIASTAEIMQSRGLNLSVDEIVTALNDGMRDRLLEKLSWQDDAYGLIQRVREAGIPCALVTASFRMLVDSVMVHADGLFDAVIVGDEVENGKPHPEPYLTAAAKLGVHIEDCIALEDSYSGVASALASGAHTIAVRRQVDFDAQPRLSRVAELETVTIDDLRDVVNGAVLTRGIA